MQNSLQRCFNGCPRSVRIVLWYNDGDLVANVDAEERDAGEQNAILAAVSLDVVDAVVLDKCTDDLLACHWADLLVDEAAVVSDGSFQNVALNQL